MIKIHEIELSSEINDLYMEDRYDAVLLVPMLNGIPLGKIQIPIDDKNVFDEEFLTDKISANVGGKFLTKKLFEKIDATIKKNRPAISVVVCTRDRATSLKVCLKSLVELDYPAYEVIVVDNCTKDDSVFQVAEKFNVKYVRENKPGLDYARNRGIREASFDIVAFIDDDAIASGGWLNGIALGFNNPQIFAVTGLTLPAELESDAQVDFELYGGMSKGYNSFTISKSSLNSQNRFWSSAWGVGTNMAFRKKLFDTIGDFNVALDVGTPTCGGGDIEMFQRTVSFGYKLRYEPSALVKHFHRKEYAALKKQIFNNGKSFPAYLLTVNKYTKNEKLQLLNFAFVDWLLKWLIFRMIKSILKLDRKTFLFAYNEFIGALFSPFSYIKSTRKNFILKKSSI